MIALEDLEITLDFTEEEAEWFSQSFKLYDRIRPVGDFPTWMIVDIHQFTESLKVKFWFSGELHELEYHVPVLTDYIFEQFEQTTLERAA